MAVEARGHKLINFAAENEEISGGLQSGAKGAWLSLS